MRHSSFAAVVLVALAVGACDRHPIGVTDERLVGRWASDLLPYGGTAPNGAKGVQLQEEWELMAGGTFTHVGSVIDPASGLRWTYLLEKGVWTVSGGALRAEVKERFSADPENGSFAPVVQPVELEAVRMQYTLSSDVFALWPPCPIGVYCIPRMLHRVIEEI